MITHAHLPARRRCNAPGAADDGAGGGAASETKRPAPEQTTGPSTVDSHAGGKGEGEATSAVGAAPKGKTSFVRRMTARLGGAAKRQEAKVAAMEASQEATARQQSDAEGDSVHEAKAKGRKNGRP